MESSSQISQSPSSGVDLKTEVVAGIAERVQQRVYVRFNNLPNTPPLFLDTTEQVLKYDPIVGEYVENLATHLYLIATDTEKYSMAILDSPAGQTRCSHFVSLVTPRILASLERVDEHRYRIIFKQGGTPQEFRVNRKDATNFSMFVELSNGVNAYMTHDVSHSSGKRGVYMDTRVVESQSYTIWPVKVPL